jgi:outer membrane protein
MKITNKITLSLLALGLMPFSVAQADTLFGIYAGAGTWQQDYSGEVVSSISNVDIEDDLGLDGDDNAVFYLALEHGVPVLPNLRAQHFSLDVDGNNVLSRTIEFNGQVFNLSDAVTTVVDLSQSDAVFYYEVLDNAVSLDLGLAVSLLDGSIEVGNGIDTAVADFDEVVPMLYAKVRADLPLTGLWVGAKAQGMSYDDNSLIEFDAQIGWESEVGFGIEAGYRAVQIKLDTFDDVDNAEIDVSGPYAAINYHF